MRSFKAHPCKKRENILAYFMMATVMYTNNSAETAGVDVEILIRVWGKVGNASKVCGDLLIIHNFRTV